MCVTHGDPRTVTVDTFFLSTEDIATLLRTLPDDQLVTRHVKRKLKRNDAPGVAMAMLPIIARKVMSGEVHTEVSTA